MTTMDFKIMAVRTGFVAQGSTPNHALQLSKLGLTYMGLADAHVLVSPACVAVMQTKGTRSATGRCQFRAIGSRS
jgi:hypothetical protein